jgi:hypothetical protein
LDTKKIYLASFYVIVFIMIVSYFFVFVGRDNMSDKRATNLCAYIVYLGAKEDFVIVSKSYDSAYSFSEAKMQMTIKYVNGVETFAECVFQKKYKNNEVILKTADYGDSGYRLISHGKYTFTSKKVIELDSINFPVLK